MPEPKDRPRQPRFNFPNLHDWFAGEAMKAILTCSRGDLDYKAIAQRSFIMANAMLTERARRRNDKTSDETSKPVGSFNL